MSKEPINLKLAGPMRIMKAKEALASVKLDGDTMDCTKCVLGKDYRKQLVEEIEKHSFTASIVDLSNKRVLDESWWQQFKRGEYDG